MNVTIKAHIAPVFSKNLLDDPVLTEINGEITTAHPSSSYGLPVLVADDGSVYGPGDMSGRRLYLEVDTPAGGLVRAEQFAAAYDACKSAGWKMED